MAKYRRRRYYRRKGKWSPNIFEIGTTTVSAPPNQTFMQDFTLAENPVQSVLSVSQLYTVKRFEVSFYIDISGNSGNDLEDIAVYLMYVPQGMNVTSNYNLEHPEYIMNYKLLGSPSIDYSTTNYTNSVGQQYQPYKIRTNLSRKLNTGDKIILFIKGNNLSSSNAQTFDLHGLVRWWTKAN